MVNDLYLTIQFKKYTSNLYVIYFPIIKENKILKKQTYPLQIKISNAPPS